MAQKVFVEILDDIDGSPATHTVPFALDGITYEIDLSDDNAAALRDELARYIESGRRTGGRRVRVATGQSTTFSSTGRERTQQIRSWAYANGYEVSARGRLAAEVIAAFERAQAPEPVDSTPAPRRRPARKKAAAAKK
ncbi:histone-like nucleoid-structuring protein Lsr2 [Amycolatopsis sp. cmx-4-83]|uniref:histone-like nucleoid-structuring protein Lsr2 n=1 Tax=Amycolatopsis sp. cmx-4-83 TaxID=2790940 RepID=UPI00397DA283